MKIYVVRYVHAGRMSFVNTDGCTTVVFGQVCPRADALGPSGYERMCLVRFDKQAVAAYERIPHSMLLGVPACGCECAAVCVRLPAALRCCQNASWSAAAFVRCLTAKLVCSGICEMLNSQAGLQRHL